MCLGRHLAATHLVHRHPQLAEPARGSRRQPRPRRGRSSPTAPRTCRPTEQQLAHRLPPLGPPSPPRPRGADVPDGAAAAVLAHDEDPCAAPGSPPLCRAHAPSPDTHCNGEAGNAFLRFPPPSSMARLRLHATGARTALAPVPPSPRGRGASLGASAITVQSGRSPGRHPRGSDDRDTACVSSPHRVGSSPLRVGVGEVCPDVAQSSCSRAQERVGDRAWGVVFFAVNREKCSAVRETRRRRARARPSASGSNGCTSKPGRHGPSSADRHEEAVRSAGVVILRFVVSPSTITSVAAGGLDERGHRRWLLPRLDGHQGNCRQVPWGVWTVTR